MEEVIFACLDGDIQDAAMDFAVWMSENKLPFKICTSTTRSQRAIYNGKVICQMQVYADNEFGVSPKHNPAIPQHWVVTIFLWDIDNNSNAVTAEGMQDFVWNNIAHCVKCKRVCDGGRTLTILNKEIDGICRNRLCVEVKNPDVATIKNLKKLIEFEKKAKE